MRMELKRLPVYIHSMTTAKQRNLTVRSVTLDDSLVKQIKAVGLKLVPRETSLSRLLDRAMAEFIERHGGKGK